MGLGPAGPNNPLSAIGEGPLACLGGSGPPPDGFHLIAADACLGVPGIPQSATGGTSLFTGVNAPALIGKHVQGYPNTELRELIAREGLLRKARERGAHVDFANAYTPRFFERGKSRHRSVTTVMAETAGIPLKGMENLRRGEAVYRDFTNQILIESGFEIEKISPEQAGARLGRMAKERDLLLYEYFQTDVVGHRGTFDDALFAGMIAAKCLGQVHPDLLEEKQSVVMRDPRKDFHNTDYSPIHDRFPDNAYGKESTFNLL